MRNFNFKFFVLYFSSLAIISIFVSLSISSFEISIDVIMDDTIAAYPNMLAQKVTFQTDQLENDRLSCCVDNHYSTKFAAIELIEAV